MSSSFPGETQVSVAIVAISSARCTAACLDAIAAQQGAAAAFDARAPDARALIVMRLGEVHPLSLGFGRLAELFPVAHGNAHPGRLTSDVCACDRLGVVCAVAQQPVVLQVVFSRTCAC